MSHFRIKRLAGVRLPQHFFEEFGDTSVNNHCGGVPVTVGRAAKWMNKAPAHIEILKSRWPQQQN
jgi:hypothetical protein